MLNKLKPLASLVNGHLAVNCGIYENDPETAELLNVVEAKLEQLHDNLSNVYVVTGRAFEEENSSLLIRAKSPEAAKAYMAKLILQQGLGLEDGDVEWKVGQAHEDYAIIDECELLMTMSTTILNAE